MSMVMGIVSMVAGLAGSMSAAKGQKDAAAAENDAMNFNADIADSNAGQIREKAAWDEGINRDNARQFIGRQRTMYAKSGVNISEGSPLLIMADSAEKAEKDALAIRWGGDVAATEQENQANLLRFYGRNSIKAGNTQANATMLQGIGQAGMAYGQAKYKGNYGQTVTVS